MIKVLVKKQSNYPVKTPVVKKALQKFFENEGVVSDAFVSVALVGEDKMRSIGKKYYKKDEKLHNVFSFVESEAPAFIHPQAAGINLGEIIVCYPVAVEEANKEGKLIEEKVLELILHAGDHLVGRHHPEL